MVWWLLCVNTQAEQSRHTVCLSLSLISYSDQWGMNHHKRCCQVLNSREKMRASANQCLLNTEHPSFSRSPSISLNSWADAQSFPAAESNDVTAGKHWGTFQVKQIMNLTPFTCVLIHILDLIKSKKKWLAIIIFLQNKHFLFSSFPFGCSLKVSRQ